MVILLMTMPSCVTNRATNYLPSHTADFLEMDGESLEASNRTFHSVNDAAAQYVMSPAARTWRTITPQCVRTGLTNFFRTLTYPLQLVTHALTADFDYCWTDTKRFFVNITAGGLGFWDVATGWNLPYIRGDFNHVFATWGIGKGADVSLPIIGPSDTRALTAMIFNYPFAPLSWGVPMGASVAIQAGESVNTTSGQLRVYDELFGTHSQNYEIAKFGSSLKEAASLNNYTTDYTRTDFDPDDSLGFTKFYPKDGNFFSEVRQHKAKLSDDASMPYSSWPLEGSDRLVIILPGIGGHRNDSSVWAMAELYRNQGCAVVALSSTLCDDYFLNLDSDAPSGYLVEDVKRLARVIDAVVADFSKRYSSTASQKSAIVGYSLGALNALHLANLEKITSKDGALFKNLTVKRYLCINPPVQPMHALRTIDKFFDIPNSWPESERAAHLHDLKMRLSATMNPDFRNPGGKVPPFTRNESRFLIGLSMRLALAECLQSQQKRMNTGLLVEDPNGYFHRNNLFAETLAFGFDNYVVKVLVPYYQQHGYAGWSRDDFAKQCTIRNIEQVLSEDSRIIVFQNQNDFLITPEDCEWYKKTFGQRLVWFERGGHLGSLFDPQYQDALFKATF